MIFELKKWWGYSVVKILIVLVLISPFFMTIHFINGYKDFTQSNNEIVEVYGYNALKNNLKNKEIEYNPLTNEKLNDALLYLQKFWEKENAYALMEVNYPGYYSVLYEAYQSTLYGESQNIMSSGNEDSFYTEVENRRKEKLISQSKKEIDISTENYLKNQSKNIEKPFIMGEYSSWMILIKSLYLNFLILMFIIVVFGAVVFSIDKETNMDLVLYNSQGGVEKLRRKKLMSFLIVQIISALYLLSISVSILFLLEGLRHNISIQVLPQFLTSF